MNFILIKHPSLRLACLAKNAAFFTVLVAISACTSSNSFLRKADSSLPIQIVDSNGGKIASSRAFESSDRLYVAGSLRRSLGSHIPTTAHIDVELISASGRVIAEKQDNVTSVNHPRTATGRSRRHSYVASFPLETAREATSIRVTYHPALHPGGSLGRAQR